MKQSKKAAKRLESRMKDYADMMNSKNNQTLHSRKETGGFRRPGSNSK